MPAPADGSSAIGKRRRDARASASAGYEDRREQLLKVAGEIFKAQGFQGASINDIATAWGSDRASIYYYYSSKQELFLDLVSRAVTDVVEAAEAIEATGDSPTQRLARQIASLFDSFERHYPYLQLYLQEDVSRIRSKSSPMSTALMTLGLRYEAALRHVMDDGISSGEFRAGLDPHLLMLQVLGAVNWSHRWFRPGAGKSGEQIGQEFADVFLNGVVTRRRTKR